LLRRRIELCQRRAQRIEARGARKSVVFDGAPDRRRTPGREFFRGPAAKFRGDFFLECLPIGSEWSLTVSDSPP
jgi:hypothetical protein